MQLEWKLYDSHWHYAYQAQGYVWRVVASSDGFNVLYSSKRLLLAIADQPIPFFATVGLAKQWCQEMNDLIEESQV